MKDKNSKSALIIIGGTVIIALIGVIVLLVLQLSKQKPVEVTQSVQPSISVEPTVEPTAAPTEEPSEDEPVPDHTERQAELGPYMDSIIVDENNTTFRNSVAGLGGMLTGEPAADMAAIERMLSRYVDAVYTLEDEPLWNYVGDKTWNMQDKDGYPIQIVRGANHEFYMFYESPELDKRDVLIEQGLEPDYYGFIQPAKESYKSNELYKDVPEDVANRLMSALIDGEGYTEESQFYLCNKIAHSKKSYFEIMNIPVTYYYVNVDMGPEFVEIFLTADKYYVFDYSYPDKYESILETDLVRNQPEENPIPTVAPTETPEVADKPYYYNMDFTNTYRVRVNLPQTGEYPEPSAMLAALDTTDFLKGTTQWFFDDQDITSYVNLYIPDSLNGYLMRSTNGQLLLAVCLTDPNVVDFYVINTGTRGFIIEANAVPE